jgi:CheY-like chemotaxis protein
MTDPRTLRIFVVENHPDTRKAIVLYLEQMGHQVSSAESMEEALQALPASEADVLLSDIGLPDGDGWELMRRIRLERPIFGIAMSGFGMNSDRVKSKAVGFRHHILKPFNPDELDHILEEAEQELPVAK